MILDVLEFLVCVFLILLFGGVLVSIGESEECSKGRKHEWSDWIYEGGVNYRNCMKCKFTQIKAP